MPAAATKKAAVKKTAKKKETPVSTDVLINLVLDKSGSMGWLAKSTIEGVNKFFSEQRELEGRALLSMTLFDTEFEVRFVAEDLTEIADLGTPGNPYAPGGGTALYDAVATTIQGTTAWLGKHKEFDGKVVCVINTDGQENKSQTTTLDMVNDLIREKTGEGWEFVFMGAGNAAWTEGNKFTAIPTDSRIYYDNDAASNMASYASVSTSLSNTRSTGSSFTGK